MHRALTTFASLLNGVLALVAAPDTRAQDETSRVEASPIAAAPGKKLKVLGQDLAASHTYDVVLTPSRGSNIDLGNATTNASGDFTLNTVVPSALAVGEYQLRVQELFGIPTALIRARAPFFVLGPLSIVATSTITPRPGNKLTVTVSGLVPGTLEVKYAGGAVYGPAAVSGTSRTVTFVIPSDRPASLPASVPLLAINRVGQAIVNSDTGSVNVSPKSATPFQIVDPTAPPIIKPKDIVPVSGRLTREDGIAPGTRVDAYWFGDDGSVIPLPGNAVAFDPQGNFSLNTRTPGLLSMSAGIGIGAGQMRFFSREPAQYADDDEVFLGSTGDRGAQAAQLGIVDRNVAVQREPVDGEIEVIVRGTDGQPLSGAVVEIAAAGESIYPGFLNNPKAGRSHGKGAEIEARQRGRSGQFVALFGQSQFTHNARNIAESIGIGPAPFITPDCPATLQRQVSDAAGRVRFQLNLDVLSELIGGHQCREIALGTGECIPVGVFGFAINVYGGQLGRGHRNPFTEAYIPATYYLRFYEDPDTRENGQFFQLEPAETFFEYSASGEFGLTPSYTVRLPPLSVPAVVLEDIRMYGLPRESAPPTGGGLPPGSNAAAWFAPRLTFPSVPGFYATPNPIYSLFFNHSPLVGGTLTDASLWFDTDSNGSLNRVGGFVFSTNQLGSCGLTNLDTYELPFGAASTTIGGIFRTGLSGLQNQRIERCGEIRATNQAGATSARQVCFQFAPLLNEGIFNGDTDDLVINDDIPGFITYSGNQDNLLPSASKDLDVPPIDDGDGDGGLVDRSQENRITNSIGLGGAFNSVGGSYVNSLIGAQTDEEKQNYRGIQASETVARSSANRQSSKDGATQSANQSVNAAESISGSLDPVTVLDISFPLFYYVWGISPIAGLEMGADMSLLAQFIAQTTLKRNEINGAVELVSALTKQIVDVSIDFYADLDVLFDLVDGQFTLSPILCAGVQVEKPAGGQTAVTELARVKLVMDYLISIYTPPPFPNIEVNDSVTLADEGQPACQTVKELYADKGAQIEATRPNRYRTALGIDYVEAGEIAYLAFTAYSENIAQPPPPGDAGKMKLMVKRLGLAPIEITRAYGIRQLELKYYAANKAVLVWVQSADPPPANGGNNTIAQVAQIVSRQHVKYSRWNGTSWGAPINLTAPGNGGEGGLTLAGCHASHPGCDNGKVLAVWTRSTTGNFRDLRTRIFRSEFTPAGNGTWSTPTGLDGTGVNDSHPTAAYRNGEAVVAWLRNTAGTVASAKNRTLAYRVLDGTSPVRSAGNVPAGVSWPKLASDKDGNLGIAFAAPDDPRAFLGNRQAVHVAKLTCAGAGTCTFNTIKVRDRRGRALYAERPIPTWDSDATLYVGYRGVSYGVDSAGTSRNYVEDPPGIRFKTGEAMLFSSSLVVDTVEPIALTNDGGGYSSVDIAYDGAAGSIIASAVRSDAFVDSVTKRAKAFDIDVGRAAATKVALNNEIFSLERMHGPDFALTDVELSLDALVPGTTRTVDVSLINGGSPYAPAPSAPVSIHAYWDNPSASGGPATSAALASLASGAMRTVRLNVPVPAGFSADEQHVLYVRIVDGGGDLVDIDASNNQRAIAVGGMPIPQALAAATQPDLPLVRLEWTPSTAAQVKGYRVYVQEGTGPIVPLGSSPIAAFVDLSAEFGVARNYYVSTYSARGIESPLSEVIAVMTEQLVPDGLFSSGFESP